MTHVSSWSVRISQGIGRRFIGGCLPFNGKGLSKSANQSNEKALTIWNSISRNCFRLIMRDWRLKNLPNGKEISVIPFGIEKVGSLWRWYTIFERIFRKLLFHLTFKQNFRIVLLDCKQPWIKILFWPWSKQPRGVVSIIIRPNRFKKAHCKNVRRLGRVSYVD